MGNARDDRIGASESRLPSGLLWRFRQNLKLGNTEMSELAEGEAAHLPPLFE